MLDIPYSLAFAGVPFLEDRVAHFSRADYPKDRDSDTYRPLADLMDEIDRILPFRYGKEWIYPSSSQSRNLNAVAQRREPGSDFPTEVKVGEWYYPTTASRWSVFRGLMSSEMVNRLLFTIGVQGYYQAGLLPGQFVMQATPSNANNLAGENDDLYRLESQMYLLPPKPLAEHGGQFSGLYLITLVDERYYFQGTPVSLPIDQYTTWLDILAALAIQLGITINDLPFFQSETVYGQPEPDSQLWCSFESAPVILDAVAANLGRTVVRRLDGTYDLLTPVQSESQAILNRGDVTKVLRNAGGDYFSSGTRLPVGPDTLFVAKNAVLPQRITVSFPAYVIEDDPVPHFLNQRYKPDRASVWYEDGYGGTYDVIVPIQSGGSYASGLYGVGDLTFKDTAKALLSGEINFESGRAINHSGLSALAMQLAYNHYGWQVGVALDEAYPGTYSWQPDGFHDIVWTYSPRARQGCTRVIHSPWTQEIVDYQHATPSASGTVLLISGVPTSGPPTIIPRGVGGPSVAQTWQDEFGKSGTLFANQFVVSGDPIQSGTVLSGNVVTSGTLNPGYVFSQGRVQTQIQALLVSGQINIQVANPGYFPTQNRWKGQINDERMLFEGTSGHPSAFFMVYRGIEGTTQPNSGHNSGSVLYWVNPDRTYGVNLVTHEKGQFIFPQAWTSGGVQEVHVVPQTQTVQCLAGSGKTMDGQLYYSGIVQLFDPGKAAMSGPWISGEYVWLIERNEAKVGGSGLLRSGPLSGGFMSGNLLSGAYYSGTAYSGQTLSGASFSGSYNGLPVGNVQSGLRYDGQLMAFSPNPEGTSTAAPVYAVEPVITIWNLVVQSVEITRRSGILVTAGNCNVWDVSKDFVKDSLQPKNFTVSVYNLMTIDVVSGIYMTAHRSPFGYWYVGPPLDFGLCSG